jgi:rhodanese-related sulfurtransferase
VSEHTITPQDLFNLRQAGLPVKLVDVRTPREFDALHADGARSIPLNLLEASAVVPIASEGMQGPIYVICQSGSRSAVACQRLRAAGLDNVFDVKGGTKAWAAAGLPIVRGDRPVLSIERQIHIAAGALVLLGNLLGWQFHPVIHVVSAFVGAGLLFAGITDWCGMGLALARMPWNRR